MQRRHLEIILQVRTGCSQGRAATERRSLAALPAEPTEGKTLVFGEIMVNPGISVVAVTGRGNRAKEVVGRGGQVADQVLRPETIRPN